MRRIKTGILTGLERWLVFNRLRATIGLRWEPPWLMGKLDIQPGSLGLEIGTGLGWGTLGLVQRNNSLRVIATDLDGRILPATRSYLRQQAVVSHVAFAQADARRLPFPDNVFNVLLALYVLRHVIGYREVLKEIGRVTRPGGRFLFVDLIRARWMPRFWKWVPPNGLPSQGELVALLAEVEFQIEHWRGLPAWAFVVAHKQGDTS